MSSTRRYMYKKIWQLAWPVILEMTGVMLAGVIITAMVGKLGAVSLSAVGLATLVQFSAIMIFSAAGTGAAAIVARETGAGNAAAVRAVAGQSVLLGMVFGALIGALGFWGSAAVFRMTGAEPETAALASRLLALMFLSAPFYLVMAIGNSVLRAMSRTGTAFVITTLSNILYLAISFMLIFGYGVPAIGADGVAWGVIVSQVFGGIAVLAVLAVQPGLKLRPADVLLPQAAVIKRVLDISVPAALEQLAMQGGRIVFTFMLAGVGAVQFAAHQIAIQVESISFMPGFGFSVAVMTLVGQHLGKGVPHRAEQYVWMTLRLTFWSMSLLGAVFFAFARPLAALFISEPDVLYWGALCVMIAAFEQPTIALTYVFSGALRGAGDTKWPMYVTTSGIWLLRLPFIYLLISTWHYNITAAWFVTAADFFVRSIILWRRFVANKWKKY
ncbi:MAG: MATE family efflux transporter [Negativicutes bacterium]|nr:MATE family efflux transporter [Negativicutes bacterium]